FVPTNHALAVFVYDLIYPGHKIIEILLLGHMALITSGMEVGSRGHFGNFPDYIAYKGINRIFMGVKSTKTYLCSGIRPYFFAIAVKLRVGQGRCIGMAGHSHLGDDRNVMFGGIGHNILIFLLGIDTSLAATDFGTATDLGEFGPGFDLYPPSLIIGKV